jgi:amino acid adenylation domain-containing protein
MDLEQRIAQLSPAKLALLERKLKKGKPAGRPESQQSTAQRQKVAPLSFSQERLWFLEQMEPETCLYNLPTIVPLLGPVDPVLVEQSVREIVLRHSALRTRFVIKDDTPLQVVADDPSDALDYAVVDLRASGQTNGALLSQTINDHIWVPFNLATGPLLRARLILQRDHQNVLLVVMHHIVSDGWSINIFTKEFRALYEAGRTGSGSPLPPLPQQYVDYSLAQRKTLEGERLQSLLAYWRRQLEGAPSLLGLPLDHPRPARQSYRGTLHPFTIPKASLQNLKALCRECGVVPFMVLLAAFKVLLHRYTNQAKIVVGTPIANRNHSELESVIGFFTNTLVLCSEVSGDLSFRELLARVRETTLGAYEHQELPFEKLVTELQPERSLSHNPVFQVMFTFQNLPTEKAKESGGQAPSPVPENDDNAGQARPPVLNLDVKFSKFDLTLAMTETDDGMSAVFEYATDLFEAGTIERMAGHYINILERVLERPDEVVSGFSFLTANEEKLIVRDWNDTRREWDEILPLHGRFERQANLMPDATALIFKDEALTYAELERRANRVARLLRAQGIERGDIVGICLPRSLEMVIGLYAILKAGAAYMPIEPDFPEGRVAYMIADARVTHVLTTAEARSVLSPYAITPIALDEIDYATAGDDSAPPIALTPNDAAYVLFTSGSTGQPKGVMVSHGAIDNRLQWMQERYQLTPDDRVMQKTPYTFDVSVWEFFWPLAVGAALVVAEPGRHKESVYLAELIRKERVTVLHFVPSMLQLFLHEDLSGIDSLKKIICSGEALTVEQCRQLNALPGVTGHNLYGPTEAAVDVTHWDCREWRDQYLSIPIGKPISNTQIYILNEKLQPAPIGVPGELYIGGVNLAIGYINKPQLTARQFVPSPFAENARLYRTGDLARFRADGNIEYIGRIDSQVKLRGLRIELGEIESLLRQYPGIAEAVVIVYKFGDHDERLAAYVVLENPDAPVDMTAVGTYLAKKLPNYMIPATIMAIPELPLSSNGKLDRKRLPEPTAVRSSESSEPVTDIEREILAIWKRFLKTDAVDTNDDFFSLGGHSILATQVINSINGHYHLNAPVRLLFENPTVKLLAKALSEFEDEAWLDESKMVTAMLMRSNRRLWQSLGEASEEELDEFLTRHLEDPRIAKFEDTASLLAWARKNPEPRVAPAFASALPDAGRTAHEEGDRGLKAASHEEEYWISYAALASAKAVIETLRARTLASLSHDDAGEQVVARLREEALQVFGQYAVGAQRRFSNGGGLLPPPELWNRVGQLMSLAALAASLG